MKRFPRRLAVALLAAFLVCLPTSVPVFAGTQVAIPIAKAESKVWGNSSSKVYHCPGTKYYGNTARGEYLTESQAQERGYRAAYGKTCGGGSAAVASAAAPLMATPAAEKADNSVARAAAGNTRDPKVWVNTPSKVYHCPGTRYYGTTKRGAYMTQTEARAQGNRPAAGKVCG